MRGIREGNVLKNSFSLSKISSSTDFSNKPSLRPRCERLLINRDRASISWSPGELELVVTELDLGVIFTLVTRIGFCFCGEAGGVGIWKAGVTLDFERWSFSNKGPILGYISNC